MDRLSAVLERARTLGFLGPGETEAHRAHSMGFVRAWSEVHDDPPASFCDLGAGGGVPGLVLGLAWPTTRIGLLEASSRRCQFLREAVDELGLAPRADVHEGRAEHLARAPELEGRFELVTARSFGPPATTAECSARLLAPFGTVLVAEPPGDAGDSERWPPGGLGELGLEVKGVASSPNLVVLVATRACPDRYPRRDGVPLKRPLF